MIQRYTQFWFCRKGSGNSFFTTFCVWFFKKSLASFQEDSSLAYLWWIFVSFSQELFGVILSLMLLFWWKCFSFRINLLYKSPNCLHCNYLQKFVISTVYGKMHPRKKHPRKIQNFSKFSKFSKIARVIYSKNCPNQTWLLVNHIKPTNILYWN